MTFREIKELIEIFDNSKLSSLNIKDKDFRIELNRYSTAPAVVEKEVTTIADKPKGEENVISDVVTTNSETINSPMVGTFYQAPSPDSPPYVKVGDKVKAGQVVCIVEAMKIMNEIQAEFDCEIVEVLVGDGQAVEFDTPLFRVKRV